MSHEIIRGLIIVFFGISLTFLPFFYHLHKVKRLFGNTESKNIHTYVRVKGGSSFQYRLVINIILGSVLGMVGLLYIISGLLWR